MTFDTKTLTLTKQSQSTASMVMVEEDWNEDDHAGVASNDGLTSKSLKDLEKEDESQVHSNVESNTGSHTHTNANGNSSESSSSKFSLVAAETLMILYSKAFLLFLIAVVAALMGFATYTLVKNKERDKYHLAFHDVADEIKEFSQLKAERVYHNLETFGATLTSYAMDRESTWPFVVFPDFQVRGILSNQETQAHILSVSPLVYAKDLDAWSNFTTNNQEWMAESHAYDESVHPDLYEMEKYESSYDHKDDVRWNETEIAPYVWVYNAEDRYAKKRVSESLFYAPMWQRAPPCDYSSRVNQDLRSDPTYARFIDGMLAVDHPVITTVVEATFLETNYEYRFDPEEYAEPHSYVLSPVYDVLTENRTAVAFLSAFLRWGAYFTDVLPNSEHGIFVVLESNCGQTFTYEIFGHKAVYIGEGNLHDTRVDDDPLVDVFEFSPDATLGEVEGEIEFCHYYANVYPSKEWREQFYSDDPYLYAAVVLSCFLGTAVGFLLYDCLVQRRQTKVMKAAARTDKIVASLFPENVRDRLLKEAEHEEHKTRSPNFLNSSEKRSGPLFGGESTSETIFGSKPIADMFPETTIMFGDLVGFTAWSSTREPIQVFTLLETIYHSFDTIAKRRRVFKVETVGDCYVAVTGLPVPRKDHAIVMGKFATDCLQKMKVVVRMLETTLGPETADLGLRIGLHSGPVTAGVLRGEKGRFQLFGDTMNTASRMESTGSPGRIHISQETAEILMASKRGKWVTQREDKVMAKGKGSLQTYWLKVQSASVGTGSASNMTGSSSVDNDDPDFRKDRALLGKSAQSPMTLPTDIRGGSTLRQLGEKERRLVNWNVEILKVALQQIIARRESLGDVKKQDRRESKMLQKGCSRNVLDEVRDVLSLPQFDSKSIENHVDPRTVSIPDKALGQLQDWVARIAASYPNNPFHSFEHASHVTMSVTKLLSRIVSPNQVTTKGQDNGKIAEELHDHTFGITSDPLTQFACLIAALIHDAGHPGVPNTTLVHEQDPLAVKYNNKSVAEQNSVDLAWDIMMGEEYFELQACIYSNKEEFERFRSIIVNVVMATDIMDKDLGAQRKARWEAAFNKETPEDEAHPSVPTNRKATIVLEHLMQASDVSHTMQHWVVFSKWNERLFREMYKAFDEGRTNKDPSEGWYRGELGFFDYYIIPLAKKLETCGVFGVSSHEYLSYAQSNRREWEAKGEQLVKDYLERYHQDSKEKVDQQEA